MRILALETSSKHASVAVLDATETIYTTSSLEFAHNAEVDTGGSSSLLVPMIEASLKAANWRPTDIELVTLPLGPGSFTGLRVGVVSVKALAYVNQTTVIGLNTLEVIAAQTIQNSDRTDLSSVNVAVNAQRQQLFCGEFEPIKPWSVNSKCKTTIEGRGDWLERLKTNSLVTGTGIKPILNDLESKSLELGFAIAEDVSWAPTAESVGRVGYEYFLSGRKDDAWSIEPIYFRPSAAEERLQK